MHRLFQFFVLAPLFVGSLLAAGCSSSETPPALQESEQQLLVDKAKLAVLELRNDSVLGSAVNSALSNARGVLIFPNLVRGGLGVGVGGGTGTLLAHTPTGWSDPAFYLVGEGAFGLQIGAEAGRVMLVIRNDGALNKIVDGNVNLGVDVSVAVGPLGGGAAGGTTSNLGADLVAFSVQEGIFGGAAIAGGVITPRQPWNEAYYGVYPTLPTPRGIVLKNLFHNPGAAGLKAALAT